MLNWRLPREPRAGFLLSVPHGGFTSLLILLYVSFSYVMLLLSFGMT